MRLSDPNGPLMINVVKLFNTPDGSKFQALGRIYSGTVSIGQSVRVLGESFSYQDEEDMAVVHVAAVSVGVGRFNVAINSAIAGNWVLLDGVDASIKKTATITSMDTQEVSIFAPLQFDLLLCLSPAKSPTSARRSTGSGPMHLLTTKRPAPICALFFP